VSDETPPPSTVELVKQATPTPSATKNALGASVGRVLGLACSLVALPFVIRAIGVSGYGHFTTFTALLALACAAFELGLSALVARDLAVTTNRTELLSGVWRARLISSTALAALGLLASWVLFYTHHHWWALVTLAMSLGLPWQLASNLAVTVGFASHRGARVGIVELASKFLWVLFGIVIYLEGAHWLTVFVASTVLTGLPLLTYRWLAGPHHEASSHPRVAHVIKSALPLSFFSIIYLAFNRADVLGLSLTATPAKVGIYSTCYRMADAILAIVTASVAVVQPLLSDPEHRSRRYTNARERIVRATAWISALGIAASPLWLRLLAGRQIESLTTATILVGELGVGVVFYAALQVDLVALVAARRHTLSFWLVGTAALVELAAVALVGHLNLVVAGGVVLGIEVVATVCSSALCRRVGLRSHVLSGGVVACATALVATTLLTLCGDSLIAGLLVSAGVGVAGLASPAVRREIAVVLSHLPSRRAAQLHS